MPHKRHTPPRLFSERVLYKAGCTENTPHSYIMSRVSGQRVYSGSVSGKSGTKGGKTFRFGLVFFAHCFVNNRRDSIIKASCLRKLLKMSFYYISQRKLEGGGEAGNVVLRVLGTVYL
jgi:hypothetical protein